MVQASTQLLTTMHMANRCELFYMTVSYGISTAVLTFYNQDRERPSEEDLVLLESHQPRKIFLCFKKYLNV